MKKKLKTMTIFFAMLLGFAVMSIGTEQAFAMEWNETDNRYEISNYDDLKEFAVIVNSGNTGACAILIRDIDASSSGDWVPIGNLYNQYSGTFDGDGHTITALSNGECTNDDQGLFGRIGSGGIVQNVGLEDISIKGGEYVGGVAGFNYKGTIANCYNTGAVTGSDNFVGGVAGYNLDNSTITLCYNTGDVSGSGGSVGGVAGYNQDNSTITLCYNTGAVTGNSNVGGVAGINQVSGTITNCYNTGDVSGSGGSVGGVAGLIQSSGTIVNCYNTGNVSGDLRVGGVAGIIQSKGTIENCYNTGDVSGGNWVGGVAGLIQSNGTIENCYNTGDVGGGNWVGGVAGLIQSNGTIENCYYDGTICTVDKAIGLSMGTDTNVKGLTTEEMTGTGALNNMPFVYGTGETSPWMTKANDTCVQYYPHLEGFLYDTTKDPDDWPPTVLNHTWSTEWSADGDKHWHECTTCHTIVDKADHTWDAGKVTKKATEKATGIKTYTCTVCNATKTETIPKLKPSAPKTSGTPLAKAAVKKKSMTIGWNKIKGAEGYDVFFAICNHGKKEIKCKKVKTIKGNKTFKWTKSGLKKGTAYKFYVRAYVTKNGKKTYVSKSPMFHAYTGNGTKNYTNAKSVTIKNVKKGKLSLKKGKTFKIKAKVNKVNKKKKLMLKSHAPTLRYMTSNSKVATVNSSGKITAKGKGTCTVIAFAHNGVSKQIKVTVK